MVYIKSVLLIALVVQLGETGVFAENQPFDLDIVCLYEVNIAVVSSVTLWRYLVIQCKLI